MVYHCVDICHIITSCRKNSPYGDMTSFLVLVDSVIQEEPEDQSFPNDSVPGEHDLNLTISYHLLLQ